MKRIVILISGRGSNMRSIVEACAAQNWDARVVAVISNDPAAAGLLWAQSKEIETQAIDHRAYESRGAFDAALAQVISQYEPDLVLLAGFMRILTPEFVQAFEGRLVNIHPSLLPLFPGLHTHRRALEAGHLKAGATVHLVTAELDHGPVLGQAEVPVEPGDTEDTLAARVLEAEHRLYPQVVHQMLMDMGMKNV